MGAEGVPGRQLRGNKVVERNCALLDHPSGVVCLLHNQRSFDALTLLPQTFSHLVTELLHHPESDLFLLFPHGFLLDQFFLHPILGRQRICLVFGLALSLDLQEGQKLSFADFVAVGTLRVVVGVHFFSFLILFLLLGVRNQGSTNADLFSRQHVVEFGVDVGQTNLLLGLPHFRLHKVFRGNGLDSLLQRFCLLLKGTDETVELLFKISSVFLLFEFRERRGPFGSIHISAQLYQQEQMIHLIIINQSINSQSEIAELGDATSFLHNWDSFSYFAESSISMLEQYEFGRVEVELIEEEPNLNWAGSGIDLQDEASESLNVQGVSHLVTLGQHEFAHINVAAFEKQFQFHQDADSRFARQQR